jgi:hypothetical protein
MFPPIRKFDLQIFFFLSIDNSTIDESGHASSGDKINLQSRLTTHNNAPIIGGNVLWT